MPVLRLGKEDACVTLGFAKKDVMTVAMSSLRFAKEDAMKLSCLVPGFTKEVMMVAMSASRLCKGGCPFLIIWDGCSSIISVLTIDFTIVYYCPLGSIFVGLGGVSNSLLLYFILCLTYIFVYSDWYFMFYCSYFVFPGLTF